MNNRQMQLKVSDRVCAYIAQANSHYNINMDYPHIKFDKRGRVAGTANTTTNTLNFNMVLLAENFDHMLAQTVPHEVAHLVKSAVYSRGRAHGREWASVMHVFGVPADRCHNYDTTNSITKTVKRFDYRCQCCGKTVQLTTIRHNRVLRGRASYRHNTCGRFGKLIAA